MMTFRSLGRQTAAGLLSLLVIGAGQAFNRQWRKAVLLLALATGISIVGGLAKLLHSFPGLVAWVVSTIPLSLYAFVDAIWRARRAHEQPAARARTATIAVFLLLTSWHLYAVFSDFYIDRLLGVRAFKVPSPSMAPTLQEGDRVVADMQAFSTRAPQPGEVVVYDGPGSLYIKRLIAVGGDVVQIEGDKVTVNGQVLNGPGLSDAQSEPSADQLEKITVPADSFFVLGDNRPFSYDSRYRGHGLVTRSQIRGKPLYVYWATDRKRIGVVIR